MTEIMNMPSHKRMPQSAFRKRPGRQGFTLVELMITLAIFSILVGVGLPSLTEFVLGNKLASAANDLVIGTRLARSEAIKRNAAVTMCVSTDGTNCATGDWDRGWIVKAGATVLRTQPAATGLKVIETSSSVASLSFDPSGVGSTQATFKVCRATPSVGRQERLVSLSGTGRTNVTKTTTGACP